MDPAETEILRFEASVTRAVDGLPTVRENPHCVPVDEFVAELDRLACRAG